MYRMMPRVHQDDFSRRKDDPVEHQDENAPRMICMCDQDDFPEIILAKVCNTAILVPVGSNLGLPPRHQIELTQF